MVARTLGRHPRLLGNLPCDWQGLHPAPSACCSVGALVLRSAGITWSPMDPHSLKPLKWIPQLLSQEVNLCR